MLYFITSQGTILRLSYEANVSYNLQGYILLFLNITFIYQEKKNNKQRYLNYQLNESKEKVKRV